MRFGGHVGVAACRFSSTIQAAGRSIRLRDEGLLQSGTDGNHPAAALELRNSGPSCVRAGRRSTFVTVSDTVRIAHTCRGFSTARHPFVTVSDTWTTPLVVEQAPLHAARHGHDLPSHVARELVGGE